MGIFDKAKELAGEHREQVDEAIDKVGDVVDEKTGHRYADKTDRAEELLRDQLDDRDGTPPV
jgi:hypothetical protein